MHAMISRLMGFLLIALIAMPLAVSAQKKKKNQEEGLNIDDAIGYLNRKFGSDVLFDAKKNGRLIVKFYRHGTEFRTDQVDLRALDPKSIHYHPDEKNIGLKCYKDDRCVYRELPEKGINRQYHRITFPYNGTDQKSIEGIKTALVHMLLYLQEEEYVRKEPFEKS